MKTKYALILAAVAALGIAAASGPVIQRLRDLYDVKFGTLSNGQILQYNSTAARWTNAPAPAGVGDMTQAAYDADADGVIDLGAGGSGSALADPGADRIMFWDDSAGSNDWLTVGAGLSVSGTEITAAGGTGDMTKAVYDADDDGYIDTAAKTNAALDIIEANSTPGLFLTWDALGDPTTVGPGLEGYALISNGAGLAPTFQALSAGDFSGVIDFVDTGSITNVLNAEIIGDLLLGSTNVAGALAGKQPLDADLTRFAGIGAGASGDVLYRDATGWTNLVKGSDGQVLKLASGLPSWAADATGAGGSGSMTTAKEDGSQVGGADIVTLDFLGADFDLTESPDTEINIVIASAIARDAEVSAAITAATNWVDLNVTGILGGDATGIITNFAEIHATELNVTTLNVTDAIDGVNLTNIPNLEVTTGLIIPANSIALATDTTGNYVATIADSGASEITVANSGSENAAVTLAIAAGITRDTELTAATNFANINIGNGIVTNNIRALTAVVVATNVVDFTFAERDPTTLDGDLTMLHATNGAAGLTAVRMFRAGGSDRTFAIPSTWQTNTFSPKPANITNGYLTVMYLKGIGATDSSANQTNVLVSFEYYKVP